MHAPDRRRALLLAALGFLQLEPRSIAGYGTALHGRRGLEALHACLDSWRGLGVIVDGMQRRGYAVSLRMIDAWIASCCGRRH